MRYDYSCDYCKLTVEVEKPLKDYNTLESCATCNREMQRIISAPPFKLLGGGWADQGYHKDHVTYTNKKTGAKSTMSVNKPKDE